MTENEPDGQFVAPVELLRNRVRLALLGQQMPARIELSGFGETVRGTVRTELEQVGYIVYHVIREERSSSDGAYSSCLRDHWSIHTDLP